MLLAGPVARLQQVWRERGAGLSWASELGGVELFIWADNLFLLGCSLEELHRHVDEVQMAFAEVGLEFSDSSLECLRNPYMSTEALEWRCTELAVAYRCDNRTP